MMMTKRFKILANYIKDISSETPNLETFLFVKDYISKYQLNIEITSKALKNKIIEINTTLKFEDKSQNKKKSHYEIVYATVIKVDVKKIDEELRGTRHGRQGAPWAGAVFRSDAADLVDHHERNHCGR